MKQLKAILCSLSFVFAAIGCSQDELTDAATGGSEGNTQQATITFDMGTRAEMQTRASYVQRPVISSDDWQRVTDVRIYAFVSDSPDGDDNYYFAPGVFSGGKDYFYVNDFAKTKNDWKEDDVWGDQKTQEEAEEVDDEQYTITVSLNVENNKYYKFLAIGRDDISESTTETIEKENELRGKWSNPTESSTNKWNENTTLATASLTCSASTYGIACSEMFSGCSDAVYIKGPEDYGKKTIELKRIVAGVMMYLQNIPSKITSGGEEMNVYRVSICPIQYITEVLVAQDMTEVTGKPGHGMPTGDYTQNENKDYSFDKEYASIDVWDGTNFYPGIKQEQGEDGNFYLNATDGNKLLAGNFVLPQANTPLESIGKGINKSLYLVFWMTGETQDISLRSTGTEDKSIINQGRGNLIPLYWIPIKIEDSIIDGKEEGVDLKDPYKFPILGNHFYSLGQYNKATGKDEPIDLQPHFKKGESITPTLRVISPEEWSDILNPASTN